MTKFLLGTLLPVTLAAASALGCAGMVAEGEPQPASQSRSQNQALSPRGELLYNTHCIACHTTQMHWRDDKQATDWKGIELQVRRWQAIAGLRWTDADITEVSRYLNNTIYKYPQTGDVLSQAVRR